MASHEADPSLELRNWTFLTDASLTTFCSSHAGRKLYGGAVVAVVDEARMGDADMASDILTAVKDRRNSTRMTW